jgi:hypothetical protein
MLALAGSEALASPQEAGLASLEVVAVGDRSSRPDSSERPTCVSKLDAEVVGEPTLISSNEKAVGVKAYGLLRRR